MRKILKVNVCNPDNDLHTELTLSASPYTVLDALERLQLDRETSPEWYVADRTPIKDLGRHIGYDGSLFELNALCQRLAVLDGPELTIVEGLAKMSGTPAAPLIPLPGLIDMAYSTDRCHLVEEATNDYTLGRFAAGNGFVPEADDLSDEAFELLDFARIGREFRQNEGGVFTSGGYVQKHDELRQVYETLDLSPKAPDYAILVETASGRQVRLPIPPAKTVVNEPVQCLDCAAPALTGLTGMLGIWDILAQRLAELEVDGELVKYKAVLAAAECDDLCGALALADELDQYTLLPELCGPDEAALAHLEQILPEQEVRRMLPHVNLWKYGQAMIQEMGGQFTGYGLVQPNGGEQELQTTQSGMEMM